MRFLANTSTHPHLAASSLLAAACLAFLEACPANASACRTMTTRVTQGCPNLTTLTTVSENPLDRPAPESPLNC